VPDEARTLVVIPTMIFSVDNIDALCDALEVRFLANRDNNLRFCLLTDFGDAAEKNMPGDEALLQRIGQNIEQLNRKYGGPGGGPGNREHGDASAVQHDAAAPLPGAATFSNNARTSDAFLVLHRPRLWNRVDRIWMGHERKRGKLADLNAFLRGGAQDNFLLIVGDTEGLDRIRYVITLDTDTELPRDAARQFIATIAHPLNRAYYDEQLQRVTEGYGILQPRVSVSLPGNKASLYERLCGGETGIDPYTRTVSDVYQDIFGEGSFIGKGIYEVDSFERALHGRLPENRILSHDLLEGCYARAGLLNDAQLYEQYPSSYLLDVARRHRWIRGDWQLVAWLLPRVPAAPGVDGRRRANPLSALSRWKLFDNLRRSLFAAALSALLIGGWLATGTPWFWTCTALAIIFIPGAVATVFDLCRKPADVLLRQHVNATLRASAVHLSHAALTLIFLPYEAGFSLDAIIRTCWRLLVSHKRLLEWRPSNQAGAGQQSLPQFLRALALSPLLALLLLPAIVLLRPQALWPATAILLLWLAAPLVAWAISRPILRQPAQLQAAQIVYLRRLARKTWSFFETFVGPLDNWLPPDNMQEHPVQRTAHRTSPTNIGLALLANLNAYDFGYIDAGQVLERTRHTLDTLDKLERHQGHFYNWYSTESLKPLQPIYISTVDSGNLAGHLLTLRPGLLALAEQPIVSDKLFDGILDTFQIVQELAQDRSQADLVQFQLQLAAIHSHRPLTLPQHLTVLDRLAIRAAQLLASLETSRNTELLGWADTLAAEVRLARQELLYLAPWLDMPFIADASLLGPPIHSPLPFTARDHIRVALERVPTLSELSTLAQTMAPAFDEWRDSICEGHSAPDSFDMPQRGSLPDQQRELQHWLNEASARAAERLSAIGTLAERTLQFARMDYGFLYNPTTHLLAIGYNVTERRLDTSYYDLLASEVRLCSFVGIAQGQLPQEHWFALGRQLTIAAGTPTLLSWSGSMFEYLMPLLVMPSFDNTLIAQTYQAAVNAQIAYGKQRGVPWGISESGYNTVDTSMNYQYRAFGVPGLGLKRGLGDDLVVAPYASMLALMVAPEAACANLQKMSEDGFEGRYGMFEAVDYTAARLPRGQSHAVIRSFMAHHQGMGFLSLSYLLLDRPMQKRFASDPLFQATMLILQERVPKETAFYSNSTELADIRTTVSEQEMPMRIMGLAETRVPETQLLSNGNYHVMITNAGGSYSRWRNIAVTRWREDSTRDNWGMFCYVRDCVANNYWSTAYQPTRTQPDADSYEVIFSEGRAEFRRRDNHLDMHTEIVVSPEDDIEMRRTHITNNGRIRKTIEVTSYAEVVLAPAAADSAHPAFSNLFVQTEIIDHLHAIVCTRRPRAKDEQMPWLLHMMAVHGATVADVSYETDRMQFIGRNNTVSTPGAMRENGRLSGSAGSVLDPIVAIRYRIVLAPEQTAVVDIVTGVTETRFDCVRLIEKYQDRHLADRVFDLAWTHSQVLLRQLNASETDAQLYGRLANSIIYANASLRADPGVLIKNHRGQSGLWGYAISGDLPIVLLQIKDPANIELVRQMVQAHAYWRLKGLVVDLVIWYEDHSGYRQLLQEQIMGLISSGIEAQTIDRPGGIFVRLAEQIAVEDRILLQAVARAILTDARGTLAEQINRRQAAEVRMAPLQRTRTEASYGNAPAELMPLDLLMFNGLGGFTKDGREYVITTSSELPTPAPWSNVLANAHFGTVISENGQAYTWGENAHEFRLTPWNNDPVSDTGGEAFYLRDEESGHFWSPSALPCRGPGAYRTRHGQGYSVFEHREHGIHTELWIYVALEAPIKYSVLKVRNDSQNPRKLSATGYVEWVMGDLRPKSTMHVITEADSVSGTLFAKNPYNTEFADRIAFFDVDAGARTMTCDRTEFIGRNGSLRSPSAMRRARLSGKLGAGLDPCAAIMVPFELAPGQEREIVFMLGVAGRRSADVAELVQRRRGARAAASELQEVRRYWQDTLGAIEVETPDPALNVLANGWLMYQTIACRLWARSGYYQSGGAFGFRDQLQDCMALVHTQPRLLREHLVLCAGHQFVEGDVQHWWHPPSDRGVRTHCSDDYLWLPLAAHRYVTASGDASVLDENAQFLEGRAVSPEEDSYYDLPGRSSQSASVYEHCVRAIKRGLRLGSHGLPLIGSCDWNDGMDKVGEHGKGESVWLAFFLYHVLLQFAEIAQLRGDLAFVAVCRDEAEKLRLNLEQNAWDGAWYRRAYFDDGTPLGSSANQECQIDSISQSWAVLSGAGSTDRTRQAMLEVDRRLVRREHKLVQLLDPPFDKSQLNPGYIRGYVPGVRENGGQYTHAAIWTAMAFARLGDGERAWELQRMINPANHGASKKDIALYKVEPYVVAADVYAVAPHVGRGGWSWYTGSSGWMYRLIMESLLGLSLKTDQLDIAPCMPADWDSFKLRYRYRSTSYQIVVRRGTETAFSCDGVPQDGHTLHLRDDGQPHQVEITLAAPDGMTAAAVAMPDRLAAP